MLLSRKYLLFIFLILFVSLILAGVQWLYTDWRVNSVLLFQNSYINLVKHKMSYVFEDATRSLIANKRKGLPIVRLNISQKAQSSLMNDLPSNIKEWQRAFMVYPNGKLERVKVRTRGDNPRNWAFEKKSWRVKTRKKRLLNNQRVINYIVPQDYNILNIYLSYYIAKLAGITTPESRMVELFINGKPNGIYYEVEQLGELFLRNRKRMPVNIYKGEQYYREIALFRDRDLFDNPGLWSKVSYFNQVDSNDYSDIEAFLRLTREAVNSDNAFEELKKFARYQEWAKFAAYQTLIQVWHNDFEHNMRLLFDPWRGTVEPIAHDTGVGNLNYENMIFEGSPHALYGLYEQTSDFLLVKYRYLFEMLEDEILPRTINHIEELIPPLVESWSRERARYLYYSMKGFELPSEYWKSLWQDNSLELYKHNNMLVKTLMAEPQIEWKKSQEGLDFVVSGPVPVDMIRVKMQSELQVPKSLYWDADSNSKVSQGDIEIPFTIKEDQLFIEAAWLANRVKLSDSQTGILNVGKFEIVPTKFRLIAGGNFEPVLLSARNALTKKSILFLSAGEGIKGMTPARWNKPVISLTRPVKVWPKEMTIDKDMVVTHPVIVQPGTTIKMMPGTSIIFRDRTMFNGTPEDNIQIISAIPNTYWGTIALQGRKTKGSRFFHVKMKNGSGDNINNLRYTAMLSVHDTENVFFSHLNLSNNKDYDDMMHVVYCKNIVLESFKFSDAFSDSLDVDISEIEIVNGEITNSGNDAIDFMTSEGLVLKTTCKRSGDKGISIGEGSEVLIANSKLNRNLVGVESKDNSRAYIINSDIGNNIAQINASVKNWRYGTGGFVHVDKSHIESANDTISAGKRSLITIVDSFVSPQEISSSKRIHIDNISDNKRRKAQSVTFHQDSEKIMNRWNYNGFNHVRGSN